MRNNVTLSPYQRNHILELFSRIFIVSIQKNLNNSLEKKKKESKMSFWNGILPFFVQSFIIETERKEQFFCCYVRIK